jgi:hypothetical protein
MQASYKGVSLCQKNFPILSSNFLPVRKIYGSPENCSFAHFSHHSSVLLKEQQSAGNIHFLTVHLPPVMLNQFVPYMQFLLHFFPSGFIRLGSFLDPLSLGSMTTFLRLAYITKPIPHATYFNPEDEDMFLPYTEIWPQNCMVSQPIRAHF